MKRIIVSRKTSQIIYTVLIIGIIVFFLYVYFGDSDQKTIKEAAWTCGFVGVWAVMGLFGVRIVTPNDIEYYGDMYDKMISGAFANDKLYYWGLIQAIYFIEHDSYKPAMALLNSLLKECSCDRDYCAVWTLMAHIYRENEEYAQAIEYFEKVLSYEPNNFSVLTWQCVSCQKIKDIEKVIKICKKELEIDPECEDALYVLTVYHALNDDDENVEICFDRYCQLNVQDKEEEKLRYVLQKYGFFV